MLLKALVVGKEEELVLCNGPPRFPPNSIHSQRHFGLGQRICEVIQCVKGVIAEEIEYLAMVLIGAALGNDIHLRAEGMSHIGAVSAVGKIDFLDAVDAGSRHAVGLVAFRLIESADVGPRGILAVQRYFDARQEIFLAVDAALEEARRIHRTGGDARKSITSRPLVCRFSICSAFSVVPDVALLKFTDAVVPVTSTLSDTAATKLQINARGGAGIQHKRR